MDNAPNQLSKFRTKNWVEINDDTAVASQPVNISCIEVAFENCAPFTHCISEINNT